MKDKRQAATVSILLSLVALTAAGCADQQQPSLPPGVMTSAQTKAAQLQDEKNMTPQQLAAKQAENSIKPQVNTQ